MNIYVVWSGDVSMGEYEAESSDDAIAQAVEEGGGSEIEYNAMLLEENI